jgi:hypothetical protein
LNDEFSQGVDYITLVALKNHALRDYCAIFNNLGSKLTEYYFSLEAAVKILAVENVKCESFNDL